MQRTTLPNLVSHLTFWKKKKYPLPNSILGIEGEELLHLWPKHEAYCLFNLWVQMEGGFQDMEFGVTVLGPPREDIPNP